MATNLPKYPGMKRSATSEHPAHLSCMNQQPRHRADVPATEPIVIVVRQAPARDPWAIAIGLAGVVLAWAAWQHPKASEPANIPEPSITQPPSVVLAPPESDHPKHRRPHDQHGHKPDTRPESGIPDTH